MLNKVGQWRIHHLSKERGHKIDLGRRSPWWSGRQEGDRLAGNHQYYAASLGVAHHPHDQQVGGGGAVQGLKKHFALEASASSQMEEGLTKSSIG